MDNTAALATAFILVVAFAALLWALARGWRHLVGKDAALAAAVTDCAACAARPVCETGALSGLGVHAATCPNLERLRARRSER